MPFCPNCGEEVKGGAKFCANCGATISLDMAPKQGPRKQQGITIEAALSYAGAAVLLLIATLVILGSLNNPVSWTILGLFFVLLAYKLVESARKKPPSSP